MTQHAFTPGPWMATRHPTKYPDLFTWSIMQTHKHDGEQHRYGIVSGIDSEADARLIAESPAMLAALEACVAMVNDGAGPSDWWEEIRAVIARARGGA